MKNAEHIGRARAAVNDIMIAHHHDFFRCGKVMNTERIEFAFSAHHHAVVNHHIVGVGEYHVTRTHR